MASLFHRMEVMRWRPRQNRQWLQLITCSEKIFDEDLRFIAELIRTPKNPTRTYGRMFSRSDQRRRKSARPQQNTEKRENHYEFGASSAVNALAVTRFIRYHDFGVQIKSKWTKSRVKMGQNAD